MDYQVKITQSGRGGTIYYRENEQELPFGWEFAINGALLFVPSPQHWNNFCDRNHLPSTQNRRDEILERVGREVVRQKTSGGKYAIEDDYISISFG
ncbi:MAG: hypothetical protein LH614_08485 [Pyrinomonadaceae bacterium]|nr:hypothetical protein [Pyrinomonadaceae bacterium]